MQNAADLSGEGRETISAGDVLWSYGSTVRRGSWRVGTAVDSHTALPAFIPPYRHSTTLHCRLRSIGHRDGFCGVPPFLLATSTGGMIDFLLGTGLCGLCRCLLSSVLDLCWFGWGGTGYICSQQWAGWKGFTGFGLLVAGFGWGCGWAIVVLGLFWHWATTISYRF
jgi:hypothetical protein